MTLISVGLLTSVDGFTWNPVISLGTNYFCQFGAVWDNVNSLFIANVSTSGYQVVTSPDGIEWTVRVDLTGFNAGEIATGSGRTVIMDFYNTNVWYSDDGISWTQTVTTGASGISGTTALCWDGSQFLAINTPNFSTDGVRYLTSPDGVTWTKHGLLDIGAFQFLASNGAVSMIGGTAPTWDNIGHGDVRAIETSTDGVTWARRNSTFDGGRVSLVHWGDQWLAGGSTIFSTFDTKYRLSTSPDGVTWTSNDSPVDGPDAFATGAGWSSTLGQWVVFGHGVGGDFIMSSPDAVSWTEVFPGFTAGIASAVWSPVANIWLAYGVFDYPDLPVLNPPALTLTAQDITTVEVDWATVPQTVFGTPIVYTTHIAHADGGIFPLVYTDFITAPTPGTVMDGGRNLLNGVLYKTWNSAPGFADSTTVFQNWEPNFIATSVELATNINPANSPVVTFTATVRIGAAGLLLGVIIPPGATVEIAASYVVDDGTGQDAEGTFDATVPLTTGGTTGVGHYTTVSGDLHRTPFKPPDFVGYLLDTNGGSQSGLTPPYSYNDVRGIFSPNSDVIVIQSGPFRISYLGVSASPSLRQYMLRGVITIGAQHTRRSSVNSTQRGGVPTATTSATSSSGVPSQGGPAAPGVQSKRSYQR